MSRFSASSLVIATIALIPVNSAFPAVHRGPATPVPLPPPPAVAVNRGPATPVPLPPPPAVA